MDNSNELALLNFGKLKRNRFFTAIAIILIFVLIAAIVDVLRPNGFIQSKKLTDAQFLVMSAILFSGPIIFLKTVVFTELEDFKNGRIKISENGITVKTKKNDSFFAKSEISNAKIKRKKYLWGKNEVWKVKFNHSNKSNNHALIMPMGKIRKTIDIVQDYSNI